MVRARGDGALHFRQIGEGRHDSDWRQGGNRHPRYYPIPFDGTVGMMLQALDRNHNRPAHLHYIVTAPGYEKVITHIFTPDCPWLKDDAVFGVKESLIADFKMIDDPELAAKLGMPNPFRSCEWNVILAKSK